MYLYVLLIHIIIQVMCIFKQHYHLIQILRVFLKVVQEKEKDGDNYSEPHV